jgi:hypothetical protein
MKIISRIEETMSKKFVEEYVASCPILDKELPNPMTLEELADKVDSLEIKIDTLFKIVNRLQESNSFHHGVYR